MDRQTKYDLKEDVKSVSKYLGIFGAVIGFSVGLTQCHSREGWIEERKQEQIKKGIFPLDRMLTVSAEEYSKNRGKNLNEYKMVGVSAQGADCDLGDLIFAAKVPKDAEVVVGYTFQNGRNCEYSAAGTALVPKNKGLEEKVKSDEQ